MVFYSYGLFRSIIRKGMINLMKELQYPFDCEYILKKSKSMKKQLLECEGSTRIIKKIAVLGGSTTHDIVRVLELFLLNQGIEPVFYESEYNNYWQDAMFGTKELRDLKPDFIYVHTSNRNITYYPEIKDGEEEIENKLSAQFEHFRLMWDKLRAEFDCPIIQNNMELPSYRLLGNKEAVDIHGRICFIQRLNEKFYEYARTHSYLHINDIHYLSASYGLDQWADSFYWHMYKYALCLPAIPLLAHNLSNIIKSLLGKNKKALVLDLDNTLWGGIVGDDGVENLEIGQETSMGQVFSEFQNYIKAHKDIGILLNVASKNEEENALGGLNHPDGSLKPEDFIVIKANWEPKSKNIVEIANELNLLPESLVFVDDNPAEREIVSTQVAGVSVPELSKAEHYIQILDKSGFFEVTSLSEDDRKRNEMYKANATRTQMLNQFGNYEEYLLSLEMKATIHSFEDLYMARIAQLTNKSNQFNLTTKRFTQPEIEELARSKHYITLYGKLEDKFGDNGVVSVVAARMDRDILHIELWLMSCRVLKRHMEFAMMDSLIEAAAQKGIKTIKGYYYPTAKNAMVKEFFSLFDFEKIKEDQAGNTEWNYEIPQEYQRKNHVIEVQ